MIHHSSHGKRPGVPTQEGDPTAVQVPKRPLDIVQGPQQVRLVTGDPVQLQVQQGYAWNNPPAQEKSIISVPSYLRALFYDVKNP